MNHIHCQGLPAKPGVFQFLAHGCSHSLGAAALVLLCACTAPAPSPASNPTKSIELAHPTERFQADLGGGFTLDYQVERRISQVNGKSCFAFITGRIRNMSGMVLGRQSVLDVAVYAEDALLYRDLSRPMADIQDGAHADIELLVSPLFADGCPRFNKIRAELRKVFL
ncbi:MAG: hypothetical protein ORN29_05430 [Rhodoferax sp.]|nr:hypothetical protein [Rhodoferax sp.]